MAPNINSDSKSVLLPPPVSELQGSQISSESSDSESVASEQDEEVVTPNTVESYVSEEEEHEKLKLSIRNLVNDTRNLDWSGVLWDMVFCLTVHHILVLWALYQVVTGQVKWQMFVFTTITAYAGGLGITMGNHRLWTHKAFKAVLPVRIALMIMNCIAFQESIYLWCQNHRVHHKWSDTDADFTNSNRGFFFAHMGWKMYKTHPEVIKRRKEVYCKDLLDDPVVYYQHYWYYWFGIFFGIVFPTLIPVYFWNEDPLTSFLCVCLRVAITFHVTWCINSVAHIYGYKPYDKTLRAFEHNILGPFALGEGWHNYHHAFPRDYRASEMDGWCVNVTTMIIQLLNKPKWTYDLHVETDDHVDRRTARTGDASLRPKKTKSTECQKDKSTGRQKDKSTGRQKDKYLRTRKSKSPRSRKSLSPRSRKGRSLRFRTSKSPQLRNAKSPQPKKV